MLAKQELLNEVHEAVAQGRVTRQEINVAMGAPKEAASADGGKKISVVQSLFYATGIILFAAVLSVIAQTWESGVSLHLLLTVVLGAIIWGTAYGIGRAPQPSETQRGLADALLLTGSLLMIAGGYIITNQFGRYGQVDFFEAAPTLLVLAGVHAAVWYFVRRDLLYLMSVLLGVASLGALAFGVLRDANATGDMVALTFLVLFGLLAWATRVLAQAAPAVRHLATAYDKLLIVLSLLTMFVASFNDDTAVLWYLGLGMAIFGVYYLSVHSRQKVLLGTASTFLVLVAITISFRYFSEFGVTTSLIFSAMAILAVAMMTAQLNKRYLA